MGSIESFSRNAADVLRLRRALYGPEDAQALMRRCFSRSRADRINERTVWAAWAAQDAALEAALNGEDSANKVRAERAFDHADQIRANGFTTP